MSMLNVSSTAIGFVVGPEEHFIGPNVPVLPDATDEKFEDKGAPSKWDNPGLSSHIHQIRQIVMSFLNDIPYTPLRVPRNKVLEETLNLIVGSWGIDDGHGGEMFKEIAKHSAAMSDLSFNHHEFDVKVHIALFTWFMIYMDDISARIPAALESFQARMHQRLPQLDPALDHFGPHLSDMYLYFEPLCANSIICSTLEFVVGCALKVKKEVTAIPLRNIASEWPGYLRAKTSVAAAFAFMIFPKKEHPNMSAYIQAMADITFFIGMTNDILSFYKEELAGEERNYIHNRSKTLGEDPVKVLADVVAKVLAARDRIIATLDGESEAMVAWQTFVSGYMTFHTSQERYRLGELDPSLAME